MAEGAGEHHLARLAERSLERHGDYESLVFEGWWHVTVTGLHAREPNVVALLRWFDPVSYLSLVAEHGLQASADVPSMIQALLACPLEELDLSSLRQLVCGAAPLAPDVELREGYGLTECCALVSSNPPGQVRAGSVGRPVPGVEVRIVNDRDEEVVAFVTLRPGHELAEQELAEYAKERLGGYKYPREIRIVSQMPLTAVGKVDRKALRALANREE